MLIGNKADLQEKKAVQFVEAKVPQLSACRPSVVSQEFADEKMLPFFETSAKSGSNVEACYMDLVKEIQTRVARDSPAKQQTVPLSPADNGPKKNEGCC